MSYFDTVSEVKGEYLVSLQRCVSKFYAENFTISSWLIKLLLQKTAYAHNECYKDCVCLGIENEYIYV